MKIFAPFAFIAFFCFSFSSGAAPHAQIRSQSYDKLPREVTQALSLKVSVSEKQLRSDLAGATEGYLKVQLQLQSKDSFHIYKERVDFWTENDAVTGEPWSVEVVSEPPAIKFLDPISKTLKEGYSGQSLFQLKLSLPNKSTRAFPPGHSVPLVVYLQSCNDRICLLPVAVKVELSLSAPLAPPEPEMWSLRGITERMTKLLDTSLAQRKGISVLTLLILMLAGVLTAFTPCVYPLYPITLGIFSRWSTTSAKGHHLSPFLLSLSYCAGLTASYATLGVVSAASGAVFGTLTQTPAFLIGVGLLMLLSAVFFSGLLTFNLPSSLQNFFTHSHGHNYFSAALMGAGLGVVGSPCVGPVLVVLLAWLGSSLGGGGGSYTEGFLLLSAFGAGMSLPFMVLGHFVFRLKKTPHLGKYTPHVKHVGTVIMVAASMFFLIPGLQKLRAPAPGEQKVALPFKVQTPGNWQPGKWSLFDFRADWCPACIELEVKSFPAPRVAEYFLKGGWDYVQVDMTETTPATQEIAQKYGVVSLPTVLIINPEGKECRSLSLHGFEPPEELAQRLQKAEINCPR